MTYVEYLAGCRFLIAKKEGHEEITRAEFALKCGQAAGKEYTEAYFRNIEEGYQKPGRELLEAAAQAAGFDFESSLQLPARPPVPSRKETAIRNFMKALNDWRENDAIEAADILSRQKKPRRLKTGGRSRRKPE